MVFRRPERDRSSPSLGYRLSSDRQPGVDIANNRMPQYSNDIERMPFPTPDRPRFNPEEMPDIPRNQMPEYFKPIGRPGMGSYQNMGQTNMNPRFFDRRINQNILASDLNNPELRRHMFQNVGRSNPLKRPESFTNLDMLGRPDAAFKYSHMEPDRMSYDIFDTPGNPSDDASIRGTYRITEDARPRNKLYDEYGYLEGAPRQRTTFSEGYMGPRSFDEMYGGVYDDAIFRTVDPNTNQIEQFPMAEGIEQAAVDPSDYRTILKMIEAGLNPEDYMAANRGGIASLMR